MNVKIAPILLALLGGLLLAACGRAGPAATGSVPAPSLAGTGWLLQQLAGNPPVAGTQITLNFEQTTLQGSDGCNRYSGTYTAAGGTITINQEIASTMMACPKPVMQQASAYTTALKQAARYAVANGQLTLSDAQGKALASFSEQRGDLAGTTWEVTSYNNGKQAVVSPIVGTTLTAVFAADGTLSGNAGCNSYSTRYTTSGKTLTIAPPASTRMMCAEPAGVMEQEAQFLHALETAATYRIDGDQLAVRTADDAMAFNARRVAASSDAGSTPIARSAAQNATYQIEGQPVTLVDGVATTAAAPGAASQMVTKYFGNAVALDLNSDGQPDDAMLLVQERGGSGTFFYVAALLHAANGEQGTNAILLGDRIAPQQTMADPHTPAQFIVSYGERPANAPMTTPPTQLVSRVFKVENGALVEVAAAATPTP